MDERTRPLHAAWHNTILSADDPWWQTHFPRNGWNCRCTVQSLNDRDLDRCGLKLSSAAPPSPRVVKGKGFVMVPEGIDQGFAIRERQGHWCSAKFCVERVAPVLANMRRW